MTKVQILNEIKRDSWHDDYERIFYEQSVASFLEVHPSFNVRPLTSYSWVLSKPGQPNAVIFDLGPSSPARGTLDPEQAQSLLIRRRD